MSKAGFFCKKMFIFTTLSAVTFFKQNKIKMLKSINQHIYKIIVICLVLLVVGAGVTTNK